MGLIVRQTWRARMGNILPSPISGGRNINANPGPSCSPTASGRAYSSPGQAFERCYIGAMLHQKEQTPGTTAMLVQDTMSRRQFIVQQERQGGRCLACGADSIPRQLGNDMEEGRQALLAGPARQCRFPG